jgi:hypothetical protein
MQPAFRARTRHIVIVYALHLYLYEDANETFQYDYCFPLEKQAEIINGLKHEERRQRLNSDL